MKKNLSSQPSFYIYDFETFGTHPAKDRPSQFAGVRVDSELNIIDEPLVMYCKQSDDYLPEPEAVLITGITPQIANKKGVSEAEFAARIHNEFSHPDTCILGYNNIRFDDEVTRFLFYRNFYDPYAYSWKNGNSRWDLLDVVRATFALRPEGINWPINSDDLPSFKLELLTKANNISHENAHDAMSDVYATIALMKLIKEKQPKLFNYLYDNRDKNRLSNMIDIDNLVPLTHVSGMFGAWRGNTSWIVPLAWHPTNKNAVICCDLAGDISTLEELNVEDMKIRLYTPKSQLSDSEPPLPIKVIHLNKCPIIAPAKTLSPENASRLNIDREHCLKNLQKLKTHPDISELKQKAFQLFVQTKEFESDGDVDTMLYSGFFSQSDKTLFEQIINSSPKQLVAIQVESKDKRIEELYFRYKAKNFPETLSLEEQHRWLEHRKQSLTHEKILTYVQRLEELSVLHHDDQTKINLLKQLYAYVQTIAE